MPACLSAQPGFDSKNKFLMRLRFSSKSSLANHVSNWEDLTLTSGCSLLGTSSTLHVFSLKLWVRVVSAGILHEEQLDFRHFYIFIDHVYTLLHEGPC